MTKSRLIAGLVVTFALGLLVGLAASSDFDLVAEQPGQVVELSEGTRLKNVNGVEIMLPAGTQLMHEKQNEAVAELRIRVVLQNARFKAANHAWGADMYFDEPRK